MPAGQRRPRLRRPPRGMSGRPAGDGEAGRAGQLVHEVLVVYNAADHPGQAGDVAAGVVVVDAVHAEQGLFRASLCDIDRPLARRPALHDLDLPRAC